MSSKLYESHSSACSDGTSVRPGQQFAALVPTLVCGPTSEVLNGSPDHL